MLLGGFAAYLWDTYGDVPRLLARRRDGGPGIRLARVVASRARAAFPGSRRGDGNTGVSGASLTGCSFFVVRGSPAEPQPVPLGGGAGLQRSTQSTQGSPIWGIRGLGTRITIVVTGPGTPLFPPPRNGGPAFFLPLCTRVPRRVVLRTSPRGGSPKSDMLSSPKRY